MSYRALILGAGLGLRMRPLTEHAPKPLLPVGGKPLVLWQIESLVRAGFLDITINTSVHHAQWINALGDGSQFGARISLVNEGDEPTESLGGIRRMLAGHGAEVGADIDAAADAAVNTAVDPAVDTAVDHAVDPAVDTAVDHAVANTRRPFLVASGDVFTDFDYATLIPALERISSGTADAHFVLADNPPFHLSGDFAIRDGRATREGDRLNLSGITCWHPKLFSDVPVGIHARLFPWADAIVADNRVTAEHFRGIWENVGTVEQLTSLDQRLSAKMAS